MMNPSQSARKLHGGVSGNTYGLRTLTDAAIELSGGRQSPSKAHWVKKSFSQRGGNDSDIITFLTLGQDPSVELSVRSTK
ncbi:hypothetical protein HBI56_182410 [Parastagonospora nodorum]|uniref:Uncharacterized protein n=1 Tax=Phaeosphaeria nodorum (strain SN15 / ATCC MYA-4574 / FGSC 10173) TaxID=321614 RepID=A0A7U2F8Y1_PHANO|nr:hypothetical protein HBH56_187820 [Parastagonospora nodorum]QRD00938.1 hypothetical protein JI435_416020 [Parastagonospora nodorum SN15]KAH3925399.1 hypothetical protein HBH54_180750 [Parastagonospora nodorum]KAH3953092.1 hypothetical protein HBH53_035270 [Parastagonospora nodorum]KAH3959140.1 hypothetical protein HBH52_246340 [Parastagonospora nodorum]